MNISPLIICDHNKSHFIKIYHYKSKPNYEKNFRISGKYERAFFQCKKCLHMYAAHGFNINDLYSKQYLELTYKNIKGIHKRFKKVISLPKKKSDNKNRAIRVDNFFAKKDYKLLDVGSGIGVFIYEMRKKNWHVSGIEMDKRYAEYCKKFHKLNVFKKKLSKLNSKKKFDLISFNKVLEHVKNPIMLLKSSKRFLNKNGIVYIEVPDIKAKKNGKSSQEFCVDHLHIFSTKSLRSLAKKSGMKVLKIKSIHEPSGKYTLFGFLKNIKGVK